MQHGPILHGWNLQDYYLKDIHGKCPLDFVVGDEFRVQWIEFLDSIKDEMWPDISSDGTAAVAYHPEIRKEVDEKKGDRPMLPVELAEKVASGHVMPQEAHEESFFKIITTNNSVVESLTF